MYVQPKDNTQLYKYLSKQGIPLCAVFYQFEVYTAKSRTNN